MSQVYEYSNHFFHESTWDATWKVYINRYGVETSRTLQVHVSTKSGEFICNENGHKWILSDLFARVFGKASFSSFLGTRSATNWWGIHFAK